MINKGVTVNKITTEVTIVALHGKNEPYRIKVYKSGWQGRYHVISEWGDTGEFTHKLMTFVEVIDLYGVNGIDLPRDEKLFCVSQEEILSLPNDADLGEFVRKKIYE